MSLCCLIQKPFFLKKKLIYLFCFSLVEDLNLEISIDVGVWPVAFKPKYHRDSNLVDFGVLLVSKLILQTPIHKNFKNCSTWKCIYLSISNFKVINVMSFMKGLQRIPKRCNIPPSSRLLVFCPLLHLFKNALPSPLQKLMMLSKFVSKYRLQ